jgi:hypothetical protein
MWKIVLQPDSPQMTIWRMRITCWISETTDTHPEYVIFISFTRQKWTRELASMLRLYVHCLSFCVFILKLVSEIYWKKVYLLCLQTPAYFIEHTALLRTFVYQWFLLFLIQNKKSLLLSIIFVW